MIAWAVQMADAPRPYASGGSHDIAPRPGSRGIKAEFDNGGLARGTLRDVNLNVTLAAALRRTHGQEHKTGLIDLDPLGLADAGT